MIRFRDSILLAHTKLRTHKIRTGITIGVAGILFGVIFSGVFVAQGIFESVERFSREGLASRSIVVIGKYNNSFFSSYENATDESFVLEVKQAHQDLVGMKTAAAKKYNIDYDAKSEDPSPIEIDKNTGRERVSEVALGTELVEEVANERQAALFEPLAIEAFLNPYKSATVLKGNKRVQLTDGLLLPMENGKEKHAEDSQEQFRYQMGGDDIPIVQVLNASVTKPFIINQDTVKEGELPGVVSFRYAEKLLGLEPLAKDSTNDQKLARLGEVRERVGDITASFCYRNEASQLLYGQAAAQQADIERNETNAAYSMPSLLYALPAEDSCGPVTIAEDTRTQAEKQAAANLEAYQKEIGTHPGEPKQHKVMLRAIGLSGDAPGAQMSSGVSDMVVGLLSSWLYYGATWSIPADLLAEVPAELRPEALFAIDPSGNGGIKNDIFSRDEYMVEFGDKDEARIALQRSELTSGGVSVMPFGSGMLVIDQMKQWFLTGLMYALAVVGGIALIILASLIGRMVSDGRRESAVFRAIGAKRIDIGAIYGMYALLLSLRVAFFALLVGLAIALATEVWLSAEATVGARLAYAAIDTSKGFHFIGIGSWYIPVMLGIIVVTGLLASIIPIFLGSRRNPINDMRDDT